MTFQERTMIVYGLLADYATLGASNKMTAVGIFTHVFPLFTGPAQIPACYLAVSLKASSLTDSAHPLEIDFVDGDGDPVPDTPVLRVTADFMAPAPGYPLHAYFCAPVPAFVVPGAGDYSFEIRDHGEWVGNIPLVVAPAPTG